MPGPWQTRQELLTDEALQSAISDPETIRAIRPPIAIDPFPPRVGFDRRVPSVTDIMNIDRYTPSRRSWVSGMPVMRSQLMDGSFEGSGRYSMNSLGNV